MRKGYLYVPSYDKKGVYKINVANSADVTLIPLGFTSKKKNEAQDIPGSYLADDSVVRLALDSR